MQTARDILKTVLKNRKTAEGMKSLVKRQKTIGDLRLM